MTRATDSEIGELANEAAEIVEKEHTKVSCMSYEEGIRDALLWALGVYEKPELE